MKETNMKNKLGKKQIREIETQAAALLREKKPAGSDRAPYKTVAYCADGKFECETVQGCRDYLTADAILAW